MTEDTLSPSLLDRPWTERVQHEPDAEHDTAYTTFVVKRACNGCDTQLGDINDAEVACAMAGLAAPDVRHECRICAPTAPAPLTIGETLDASKSPETTRAFMGWEPADGPVCVEAIGLDWVVVRGDHSGRALMLKCPPDTARLLR